MEAITIAIDAMGGDNAPGAVIEGCLEALRENGTLRLLLCGPTQTLQNALKDRDYDRDRLTLVEAPDVITNNEHPAMAIRRKSQSSMVVAMQQMKEGKAQGFVSAGSTGAVLSGGVFKIGRIKGIERPALAPILPTETGTPVLLIDSGANADCKPDYLPQFALMGEAYMRYVQGIKDPKVGLLSIGAEDEKGNELTKAAFPLLKARPLDFVGNIEARDVLAGPVQVLVADGFSGNVFLKASEGAILFLFRQIKAAMSKGIQAKLGAALLYKKLKAMKRRLDYEEYGGAVLLGVKNVMIKAHGSSKAHSFACAIRQAAQTVAARVPEHIADSLKDIDTQE